MNVDLCSKHACWLKVTDQRSFTSMSYISKECVWVCVRERERKRERERSTTDRLISLSLPCTLDLLLTLILVTPIKARPLISHSLLQSQFLLLTLLAFGLANYRCAITLWPHPQSTSSSGSRTLVWSCDCFDQWGGLFDTSCGTVRIRTKIYCACVSVGKGGTKLLIFHVTFTHTCTNPRHRGCAPV